MRQIDVRSVDNLFAGLVAAGYADRLRAMGGLLAAGASGFAGPRPAAILSLRQLVPGIIDDVPLRARWRRRDFEADEALGKHDDRDQQQALEQPREEDAAIGENADGRFSGEGFGSAGEGGAQGGFEFVPRRRPFDEQAPRIGPQLGDGSDLGNGGDFGHYPEWRGGINVVCQKEEVISRSLQFFLVFFRDRGPNLSKRGVKQMSTPKTATPNLLKS